MQQTPFQFRFAGGATLRKGDTQPREVTSFVLFAEPAAVSGLDQYRLTPTQSVRTLFQEMVQAANALYRNNLVADLNKKQQTSVHAATAGIVQNAMTILADTMLNTESTWFERDQARRDAFIGLGVKAFWLRVDATMAQNSPPFTA